jgi:hypothetical protein
VATSAGVEKREAVIVLNRRGIARIVTDDAAPPTAAELELPELDAAAELVSQA